MQRSFRFRIALWSALLAGIALSGFSAIAWWQLRDAKLVAIDREIKEQTERELMRQWPAEHWPHHEQNMNRAFGAAFFTQIVLSVSIDERPIYRSQHWPGDLRIDPRHWPEPLQSMANSKTPNPLPLPPIAERPPLPGFASENSLAPPHEPPPRRQSRPEISLVSIEAGNTEWRLGLATTAFGEKLAIGVDLSLVDAEMNELSKAFLMAGLIALVFIGLGAWFISGRALSPIRSLSVAMANITAKGLDQRLAHNNEDIEFGQLIQVFNSMLERLERSFLQASRFSADAAHELKTPLAILQGQIEQAISQCEVGSEIQSRLIGILDEIRRLSNISRKLLLLSLADAGRLRLQLKAFDLSLALTELLEDAHMLAPKLNVSGSIAFGMKVEADAELLQQVLFNLLSNAIKYNIPQDGWIRIDAARHNHHVEVNIRNSSVGIAEVDSKRLFERFFRADPAHGRQVEGVGLGLSLSREIARAHGGELECCQSTPGEVAFRLTLVA